MESWADRQAMGGMVAKEARETGLESLQERVATFRLRSEPGLTTADLLSRLVIYAGHLEAGDFPDRGAALGAMLCDLLCLARAERADLAWHTKRAFAAMQREYEGSQ